MAVSKTFLRPRKRTGELKINVDRLINAMSLLDTSYVTNCENAAILGTLDNALPAKDSCSNELDDEELPIEIKMLLTCGSFKLLPSRYSRSNLAGVKSGKATFPNPVQREMVSSLMASRVLVGRLTMASTFHVFTILRVWRTAKPFKKFMSA